MHTDRRVGWILTERGGRNVGIRASKSADILQSTRAKGGGGMHGGGAQRAQGGVMKNNWGG